MRYLKVMFGTNSGANKNLEYKLNEVNIADIWNPNESDPKKMGGFNFSTETKILRWLIWGDTVYDIELPDDAEVIDCLSESAPHGVFRSNKIIISNPKIVTNEMAMEFYLKSNLPEKSYYKSLAGCAIRGYRKTSFKIIEDKVNKENIDLVLAEINDLVTQNTSSGTASNGNIVYNEVMKKLNEIKNGNWCVLLQNFYYKI